MKRLFLLVVVASLLSTPADAGITYSVLNDGFWQAFYQADPGAKPRSLRPNLGADASAAALAPDGRRLAFEVQGQGIMVCPLVPGGQCQTVEAGTGSSVRPTWEPRSGELIFVQYVADAGGEDSEIVITRNGLDNVGPLVTHTGNQDDPDVSPDGRWLAYSSAQVVSFHQAGVQVIRQLWMTDLATGSSHPLVPGSHQDMQPDFSPVGERLAFASNRGGGFDIWVVDLDGANLRRITSGPGTKTWPAWSPDGKSILYARAHEGRQDLWIITLDGSGPKPFEPFPTDSELQIRDPDWR